MNLQEFAFGDERAVSPVVGVALLIAIAVILAAVIGAVVLGLGTGGVDTPQAQLQAQFDDPENGDGVVVIEHNGGEPLPEGQITIVVANDSGVQDTDSLDEDLTAGNSESFDVSSIIDSDEYDDGARVTVLWEDPNSDSETVIERFEP